MVPMSMTMAAVTMSNSVTMSVPVAMSMVVITRPMPVTAPAARRQQGMIEKKRGGGDTQAR
jgi:hypothetical protein